MMPDEPPSTSASRPAIRPQSSERPTLRRDTRRRVRICWLDDFFNLLLPLPFPVAAMIIAFLWWVLAASPLAMSAQLHLANDLPLVLGVVGIATCGGFARWGTTRYRSTVDPIQRILEDSSHAEFDEARAITLKRMASTKGTVWVTLGLWMVASIAVTASWLHGARTGDVLLFDFMPADWYASRGIAWRLATVIILGLPVVAIVWTGGRMLLLHTFLILSLRRMQFIASPITCIRILRPALTLGVVASVFWAFGIVLFIILLHDKISIDRVLFLSVLSAVGTFGFVIPILGLRANLLQIRAQRLDHLTRIIIEKVKSMEPDPELLEEVNELERRAEEDSRLGPLLMGWRYVAWFVTVILIPACFLLLQYSLDKLINLISGGR